MFHGTDVAKKRTGLPSNRSDLLDSSAVFGFDESSFNCLPEAVYVVTQVSVVRSILALFSRDDCKSSILYFLQVPNLRSYSEYKQDQNNLQIKGTVYTVQ